MFHEKSLAMFIFLLKKKWRSFWNSKVVEMQSVTDSFWRIRSSSLIDFCARRNRLSIPWRNSFKIFTLSNIVEISQLTPVIARTKKRMIIKLSFLNQKTRKMRRGKKVNQTKSI